ncbi:jg12515 [Pararge aegeria aegeria]|uniref:Jg12515 protein n=1 Tax=Pararge aegeria aegeria TaxID=348720 RepID=A0A8S4R8R3_9NEOP|nr:jg12515 [Pararge aegeria aegeria]
MMMMELIRRFRVTKRAMKRAMLRISLRDQIRNDEFVEEPDLPKWLNGDTRDIAWRTDRRWDWMTSSNSQAAAGRWTLSA